MGRALLATLALAAWASTARADEPLSSRGFDHVGHEGRVFASGGDPPACVACHPLDARGRLAAAPGHDDCFGACHGPAPRDSQPGDDERARVCAACHALADSATRGAKRRRVRRNDALDFALLLSHRGHADVAGCASCHRVLGGARASRSHATARAVTAAPRPPR